MHTLESLCGFMYGEFANLPVEEEYDLVRKLMLTNEDMLKHICESLGKDTIVHFASSHPHFSAIPILEEWYDQNRSLYELNVGDNVLPFKYRHFNSSVKAGKDCRLLFTDYSFGNTDINIGDNCILDLSTFGSTVFNKIHAKDNCVIHLSTHDTDSFPCWYRVYKSPKDNIDACRAFAESKKGDGRFSIEGDSYYLGSTYKASVSYNAGRNFIYSIKGDTILSFKRLDGSILRFTVYEGTVFKDFILQKPYRTRQYNTRIETNIISNLNMYYMKYLKELKDAKKNIQGF